MYTRTSLITTLASLTIATSSFAGRPLTIEELAATIKADEASVPAHPESHTERQKTLHNSEMLAAMKKLDDALAKERQEAADKVAEAAVQAAEAAKYPKTYDDAKAWMIKHFEIPQDAKIRGFNTLGKPVRWASITWESISVTRIGGAGNGLGEVQLLQPVETSVRYHVHSRSYDFTSETLTEERDF